MLTDFISNGTNQIVAAYFLGIIFVIFFATRYFNQPLDELEQDFPGAVKQVPEPVLPCYMTECPRYRLFLGFFIFLTVLFYLFVSLALPQLVVYGFPGLNEPTVVVSVVIGTLAFINLSQKIPFLKDTLVDFKKDLQRRAKIPERAFQVFECLKRSELNTENDEFKQRWHNILVSRKDKGQSDIDENDFSFNKRTLERRWARLAYLINSLEIWSKKKPFNQHIFKPNLGWLKIRENYYEDIRPRIESLRNKTKKLDEFCEQNKNTDKIQEINQFISRESEELSGIIDDMLNKVYWLITFLLFMSNRSVEDPRLHLKKIGWITDTDNYFIFAKNSVVILGITIFLSILVGAAIGSLLASALSGLGYMFDFEVKATHVVRWLIFGIPMYIIPTLATLIAKRHLSIHEIWPVLHPDESTPKFSDRPLFTYILVASFSYLVTVGLLMIVYFFMSRIVDAMHGKMLDIAGFSLLAFATSLYISYLIDTPPKEKLQNSPFCFGKVVVATLFGLVNVGIILFFFSLCSNNGSFNFSNMPALQQGRLFVYSVIGFLIGFCIFISTQLKILVYERRTDERESSDHWITLKLGSVTRRANVILVQAGKYKIAITHEIKMLVNNGDRICIEVDKGKMVDGIIEEIRDDYLLFSEKMDICYDI